MHPLLSAVVLIIADDLDWSHLRAVETPHIDALAARGVTFVNAWSSPICSPSRSMIMTGRFPSRTGMGDNATSGDYDLPDQELTLPELVGGGHAFGKYHLARPESLLHPLQQGWTTYAGAMANLEDYYSWDKNVDGVLVHTTLHATVDTTLDALARPHSFLCVSFNAPHLPEHQPPGQGEATYAAAVRHMDGAVGRIVMANPEAVVIFVCDNGAASEIGGGKGTLLESGINVPLIIAGPSVAAGPCEALVNLTDIYATVADLMGATSVAEDSLSLLPYLADPDRPSIRTYNYSERFTPCGQLFKHRWDRAVRNARFKLVRLAKQLDVGERMYDLANDPEERHPLPLSGPVYEDLSHRMNTWFE